MKLLKYIALALAAIVAFLIGLTLLFAFVIPNPLGVNDRHIIWQANEFGIYESLRVREHLNTHNKCPENMPDWRSKSRRPEYDYEIWIPKNAKVHKSVPLWYQCDDNLDFEIWIRYGIDADLTITGGRQKNLTIRYGHFTEFQYLELEEGISDAEVRRLLSEERIIRE